MNGRGIKGKAARTAASTARLAAPRLEQGQQRLIAGLLQHYEFDDDLGIGDQWRRFMPQRHAIPNRVGGVVYGICANADDSGRFDYLSGFEVPDFGGLPDQFSRIRLAMRHYAVFTHVGDVTNVSDTVNAVWEYALRDAGLTLLDAPVVEVYGAGFDMATGQGSIEVWVPVRS